MSLSKLMAKELLLEFGIDPEADAREGNQRSVPSFSLSSNGVSANRLANVRINLGPYAGWVGVRLAPFSTEAMYMIRIVSHT